MFSIEHNLEIVYAPSWRSTVLSLSNNDELGAQILLEHPDDHYTFVTLDRQMIDERQLIFHHGYGYFLMRISQLNENIFPSA